MNCPLLDISLIPLTQGKYAIVDKDDFSALSQYKWHILSKSRLYAARTTVGDNGKYGRQLLMHNEIIQVKAGQHVDHINFNTLDNRRSNLRMCSHTENMQHKRKYRTTNHFKGVAKSGTTKFRVYIKRDKKISLGPFGSEIEAALAYDAKAKELFGEFAYLNFPKKANQFQQNSGVVNV